MTLSLSTIHTPAPHAAMSLAFAPTFTRSSSSKGGGSCQTSPTGSTYQTVSLPSTATRFARVKKSGGSHTLRSRGPDSRFLRRGPPPPPPSVKGSAPAAHTDE